MRSAGREGIRLQANPRPAACRRAPSAPPVYKTPASVMRAFLFSAKGLLRCRWRMFAVVLDKDPRLDDDRP